MSYTHHDEVSLSVSATPQDLFDHLDDQARLGSHMEKPSMMMMGGSMSYDFDAAKGRATGSVIRISGTFLGLRLFVEETVTIREPPWLKIWETQGQPRLLIIGGYRMGFDIRQQPDSSLLRIFIDYNLAGSVIGRLLGAILAPLYARWCVDRMAKDARRRFAAATPVVASAFP